MPIRDATQQQAPGRSWNYGRGVTLLESSADGLTRGAEPLPLVAPLPFV